MMSTRSKSPTTVAILNEILKFQARIEQTGVFQMQTTVKSGGNFMLFFNLQVDINNKIDKSQVRIPMDHLFFF